MSPAGTDRLHVQDVLLVVCEALDRAQLKQVVELREQAQEDPRKGPAHGGPVLLDVEELVNGAQGLQWATEQGPDGPPPLVLAWPWCQ